MYYLPSFSKPVANTCNDTRPASSLHQPISYLKVYKNNNKQTYPIISQVPTQFLPSAALAKGSLHKCFEFRNLAGGFESILFQE